MNILYCVS